MFLGECFKELKLQLSITESFDDVMELTIKKKCTVTNIDCLETIVDHYNIENARPHITTYKSSVDEICVEFKDNVLHLNLRQRYKQDNVDFDLSKSDVNMLQSDSDSEPHEKFRKMKTTRTRKHKGNI